MGILVDWQIRARALQGMIEPYEPRQVSRIEEKKAISFGQSSMGYDIRVADEFKVFTNANATIIDPKHFYPQSLVDCQGTQCIIPPNSFALARSVEYFRIPRDVLAICLGKSTLARCGIIVNTTPLEPMWRGYITIEISNTSPLPAKIYANEGIAQVIFLGAEEECETSYADRKGKYQNQDEGIVLPRI